MDDFAKAITYQLKQDIANRYFGFRKRIETESNQYLLNLQSANQKYEVGIKTNVQRMHCLLQSDLLFQSFITFTKLPGEIWHCPTEPQSPSQWQMLFADLKGEGLTRKRRYRNLVYKVYRLLASDITAYQDVFIRLEEEHEDICKQIDLFYRKNDLSGILNFLRELDNPDGLRSGLLQTDRPLLTSQSMEEELRIIPPPKVTSNMHSLDGIPSMEEAKPTFNGLLKQAYPLFDHFEIKKLPF
jgi:hypothetical protein